MTSILKMVAELNERDYQLKHRKRANRYSTTQFYANNFKHRKHTKHRNK